MRRTVKFNIGVIFCALLLSCSKEPSLQELVAILKKDSDSFAESGLLKRSFADTINAWAERKVSGAMWAKRAEWKIDDIVCLNKKRDKAVLICLKMYNDSSHTWAQYISLFYSKKINNKWRFYGTNLPTFFYESRGKVGKPTYDEMSLFAFERLTDGGLINKESLQIDDNWINGWDSEDIEKYHLKFLNDIDE